MRVSFTLNGETRVIDAEPGETLLETLRERLGMTGTKRGCEVGECGACTVLVDGVPVDSCIYLTAMADNRSILTIEGMEKDGCLSPVQQAFVDEGAVQCGFCSPGMIMSAHALLDRYENPTPEQIKTGMAGNMCRCAAYQQIIKAVQRAARQRKYENSE